MSKKWFREWIGYLKNGCRAFDINVMNNRDREVVVKLRPSRDGRSRRRSVAPRNCQLTFLPARVKNTRWATQARPRDSDTFHYDYVRIGNRTWSAEHLLFLASMDLPRFSAMRTRRLSASRAPPLVNY